MNIIDVRQEIISPDILQNIELIEASACHEMYKAADKFTRRDCGMQYIDVNGNTLLITSNVDVLAFNRVVGWGINKPAHDEDLDEFLKYYKKANVPRFFVQVSPFAEPSELVSWLQHKGFEHYNNWVKLYREAGETPHPLTDFKIQEVKKEHTNIFASIITEGFQWPEVVNDVIISLIGRKNWHHFIAWEKDEPVATGSFFKKDEYAWFCFSATSPGFRAKGAQTAVISFLVDAAGSVGCRHIFVETADEKAGNPSPSARNLMRMGFRELYKRPNYIYTSVNN